MAVTITIAQQKGGAGKTTIAAQLSVTLRRAGRKVALVDVDPQASLTAWHNLRQEILGADCGIHLVQASGWKLSTELDRLRRDYDIIIVDSPPHAETDAKVAVRAGDLVVVPVQPSPMDLWATRPTLELARKERSPALMVLNRAPSRGKLTETVMAKLSEMEVPLAAATLGNRAAFAASMMDGKGVVESTPRNLAAKEIRALAEEILAHVNLSEMVA